MRAGARDDIGDVGQEPAFDTHGPQVGLHADQRGDVEHATEAQKLEFRRVEAIQVVREHLLLRLSARVCDVQLHHEPVELRFGQRISPL